MTKNAAFKRRVRERMARTGESYTAARAQLLEPTPEPDYEALAGMTDEAVQATGRSWKQWSDTLDALGARSLDHAAIVRLLEQHHPEVSAWWRQSVTVGYERIHGLRAVGQLASGDFAASKSKTFARSVTALYEAFAAAPWLAEAEVSTARPGKVLRAALPDGTRIAATFTAKGEAKSSVSVQHTKLPSEEARAASKALWTERLAAL